jgi:hypothetical protein
MRAREKCIEPLVLGLQSSDDDAFSKGDHQQSTTSNLVMHELSGALAERDVGSAGAVKR